MFWHFPKVAHWAALSFHRHAEATCFFKLRLLFRCKYGILSESCTVYHSHILNDGSLCYCAEWVSRSLFWLSTGRGKVTPWTSRQFTAWPHWEADNHCLHTSVCRTFMTSVHLTCMFLDGCRKLENTQGPRPGIELTQASCIHSVHTVEKSSNKVSHFVKRGQSNTGLMSWLLALSLDG